MQSVLGKEKKSRDSSSRLIRILTVGHSTRSADEFNRILLVSNVKNLVDVRSFPGSRRYPQFNKEKLAAGLQAIGIQYHHFPKLGGRRRPNADSKNTAWKNDSFRAYADHMETAEFKEGVKELLELAGVQLTAIMCAEALWWKCHRSLIADYLKVTGVDVVHLMDDTHSEPHPYTSAARIVDGELSYRGLI
jgi:uncharacterized protein (DUF488 family)